MSQAQLKTLPSVSEVLLEIPDYIFLNSSYIKWIINRELKAFRTQAKNGSLKSTRQEISEQILAQLTLAQSGTLTSIINGTGIVLHTGFGRAPLSKKLIKNVADKLEGYVNLEYSLDSGKRGQRLDHVRSNLAAIAGSEDSLVVNNNAAAVLLCLNTIAEGKEVIVSRGQEVEIGGSFRIPDVVRKSGCTMVEVGTTNRTHLSDYDKAVNSNSALLLWVHTSNYVVKGFTESVELSDLVDLGRKKKIPVLADLGSGALMDLEAHGLPREIPVSEVVDSGVDLVTFSGDKLLGGPQAGIVTGKKRWIRKIQQNPIYRAVRCDKWTIAFLDELLRSYRSDQLSRDNLAMQLLTTTRSVLQRRAKKILKEIPTKQKKSLGIEVVESEVEAGSGSLPESALPSVALKFNPEKMKASELSRKFRSANQPVAGFISGHRFTIDMKAVIPSQDKDLAAVIREV